METVTAFLDKILFWHWGIVAVALGALEMLFAGGILMGAAMAAFLTGTAAFAVQQFPDALPANLRFDLPVQAVTFVVLTALFALALRVGRRRAAAMIAQAAAGPQAPKPAAPPAAPPQAPVPAPAAAAVAPPVAAAIAQPMVPAPAVRAAAAPAPSAPAPTPVAAPKAPVPAPTRPIARPAGNQPMRVTGPTSVTTPPAPVAPPRPAAEPAPAPPAPRPVAAPAATLAKGKPNPTEFIGREYALWKPIEGGKGALRISGSDWVLLGPDVSAGSRVRVVAVEGTKQRVEKA